MLHGAGGNFSKKDRLLGSTIRDLGNTIKDAKNFLLSKKGTALLHCEDDNEGILDDDDESGNHLES